MRARNWRSWTTATCAPSTSAPRRISFDYKALLESQAATPAEFDAVQSRYRVAEANVSYASITAPFDGVVGQKLCEVGDLASPGKALFVVEQPTDFRLEAQVPERLASAVGVGNSVRVLIDATGDDCAGTVAEVDPVGDPSIRSFLVKIDLQCSKPLKSGMFGRAAVRRRPTVGAVSAQGGHPRTRTIDIRVRGC